MGEWKGKGSAGGTEQAQAPASAGGKHDAQRLVLILVVGVALCVDGWFKHEREDLRRFIQCVREQRLRKRLVGRSSSFKKAYFCQFCDAHASVPEWLRGRTQVAVQQCARVQIAPDATFFCWFFLLAMPAPFLFSGPCRGIRTIMDRAGCSAGRGSDAQGVVFGLFRLCFLFFLSFLLSLIRV